MSSMNLGRKMSISVIVVVCIFIIGIILGALLLSGYIGPIIGGEDVPDKVEEPTWKMGKYWTYSFSTPEIQDVISRIVVASQDETDYQVGVASRLDAQRHAVLNYNPMLGRITVENLSIYEKGIPQLLFDFPLKKSSRWTFSMFDIDNFEAKVNSIKRKDLAGGGSTVLVSIEASASSGEKLTYSYDRDAQWIRSLTLETGGGDTLLDMNLVSYDSDFEGDVYFVRAVDLFNQVYSSQRGSPEIDFYNTFIDQGHPNWGPFDSLVYYLEVDTGDSSGGTVILKDPTATTEAMRRTFGSNTFENAIGTVPSSTGEWKVNVAIAGECYLRFRVVGGIEYTWTIS